MHSTGTTSFVRPFRSVFIALLAVAAFIALSASRASAADQEQCSDFTPNHRPCTAMENFGYCLTNAISSYRECKEDASFLGQAGCLVAYEVDFYSCAATLPIEAVLGTMTPS